ncbi:MAG: hypothetical protein HY084_08350 [Gemmatimonadetes bacterium]|nr:hypothetical protein [Gemmatimonadota bacterium]
MAIRRVNYTGRKRITRDSVVIALDRFTSPIGFEVALDLARYGFPSDAEIVIEASVDWTVERFPWGTISTPPSNPRGSLRQFDTPEGIRFALKVLGTGSAAGLILGEADSIVPSDPEIEKSAQSFIDVRPERLGHRAWKLIIDESHPILLVNESVGDWKAFARSASFRALVAPEIFRQLILKAADGDSDFDGDAAGPAWESQCLVMAARLSNQTLPIPPDVNPREDWIDAAVTAFAQHHRFGSTLRSILDQDIES